MCNAFSAIVTKKGKVLWEFGKDSHDTIITKYKLRDDTADAERMKFARIEISPKNMDYLNPDEWVFHLDERITPSWWSEWYEDEARLAWKEWKVELDKILIYKPIIHPFRDVEPPKIIIPKHIGLVKKWASVRGSVRDSSWGSVGSSVWDSVRDSVWGYTGSFFNLERKDWKYTENIKLKGYPFQHLVKLWEMGLVPSFDGKTWGLHGGKDAKILWEGKI